MEKKRVLFISQEIKPYLHSSEMSMAARLIPQGIQESGKEIRIFMPKYGAINERRHQLHEVIRLSGMNLIIDDTDHPLIIKVASIPTARMQVYFIDNEEYFKRKGVFANEKGDEFKDNDERSIFFCKGVLETVKKLGWKPDLIFCYGWMTSLLPLYVKDVYKNDPHFSDTKIIYSLYNDSFKNNWCERLEEKLKFEGFNTEIVEAIKNGDYLSLNKAAMEFSDGVVLGSNDVDDDIKTLFDEIEKHKLFIDPDEIQNKLINEFVETVIEEEEELVQR